MNVLTSWKHQDMVVDVVDIWLLMYVHQAQELTLSSESQRPALILLHQVTLPFPPNSAHHLQPLLGLGNFRDPPAFPKSEIFHAVASLSVPAPTALLLEE